MSAERLRVLMVTDSIGHTRGYHLVSTALRDAGLEVILGGVQTPSEVAGTVVQEDVDVVGYHIMCGDPAALVSALFQEFRKRGRKDIGVVVGGTVLPWKAEELQQLGVKGVFLPGSTLKRISDFFADLAMDLRQ